MIKKNRTYWTGQDGIPDAYKHDRTGQEPVGHSKGRKNRTGLEGQHMIKRTEPIGQDRTE